MLPTVKKGRWAAQGVPCPARLAQCWAPRGAEWVSVRYQGANVGCESPWPRRIKNLQSSATSLSATVFSSFPGLFLPVCICCKEGYTVLVWVERRWECYSQFLMWDINCKPHGQPHSWNKHTWSRDARHSLKRIHVDLEGSWCEGICVWHLDPKPNQIWGLPVPDGAPQACDFKAQTCCELTPVVQISSETKTKHKSVMIWGRCGGVCAEPAVCQAVLTPVRCRLMFWNWCKTRMEAEAHGDMATSPLQLNCLAFCHSPVTQILLRACEFYGFFLSEEPGRVALGSRCCSGIWGGAGVGSAGMGALVVLEEFLGVLPNAAAPRV